MASRIGRPPSLLAQPAYLASHVSKYGVRDLESALEQRSLRLVHHGLLTALGDFGPLSQQELADCLGLHKSHLVRHIDDLEGVGLATRGREPGDRRRNRVALTGSGRGLLRDLSVTEQHSRRRFLDVLSADEQETLKTLLRRVLDANDHTGNVIDDPRSCAPGGPLTPRSGL